MLNEMRDFYKALCRTVEGTKFKLISISKKCSAKLCCSYNESDNNIIYFEVKVVQGKIVSTYLESTQNNTDILNLETRTTTGDLFEVYFTPEQEDTASPKQIKLTVKTEVDFGTVSSFTSNIDSIPEGCTPYKAKKGTTSWEFVNAKNILGLEFADEKVATKPEKQGIDLRQYIHHTIETDYLYDGTYKDIKTQEVSE